MSETKQQLSLTKRKVLGQAVYLPPGRLLVKISPSPQSVLDTNLACFSR
jgi:hypothetical protein